MIDDLTTMLERGEHAQALDILVHNPELLQTKTSDGWSVLQLASYYDAPEVVHHILSSQDYEYVNADKMHPLLIALEEGSSRVIDEFMKPEHGAKIDWDIKTSRDENLLVVVLATQSGKYARHIDYLLEQDISPFEKTTTAKSAFSLAIESPDKAIALKMSEYQYFGAFEANYEDLWLRRSIQFNHPEIFERLLPYSKVSPDEMFKASYDFESVRVMACILHQTELIPGHEQITSIVEMMCKRYEHQLDRKAASELADYLFEIKIPFSRFKNSEGKSAWMLCIENDNEDIFNRLTQSSETTNVEDADRQTPLFYAIKQKNERFVATLLKKRADPDHKDKYLNTPLMMAVEQRNLDMVKNILQYSQSINETNKKQETALNMAIKKRHMGIVSELIWAGAQISTNPCVLEEMHHITQLTAHGSVDNYTTVDARNIDNFLALATLGFNLNQKNSEGDTFLLHFIKNGDLVNFRVFLQCPMNPDQVDAQNNSALMCAAQKGNDEYFERMIHRFGNIDFHHRNDHGENVYDICQKHAKAERLKLLLEKDAKITSEDAKKVLHSIVKHGKLSEVHERFQALGMDIFSAEDKRGNNMLMLALAGGNLENFAFLMENSPHPINLNHANAQNVTLKNLLEVLPPQQAMSFKKYLKTTAFSI